MMKIIGCGTGYLFEHLVLWPTVAGLDKAAGVLVRRRRRAARRHCI